ncbi:hypothetical protein J4439_02395 [Candidatus Woesearchaeota archaeon]|nr:hypothetical protein [Candidatus Woesearchaeota archaeon]
MEVFLRRGDFPENTFWSGRSRLLGAVLAGVAESFRLSAVKAYIHRCLAGGHAKIRLYRHGHPPADACDSPALHEDHGRLSVSSDRIFQAIVWALLGALWLYTLYEIARFLLGGSLALDQLILLALGCILGVVYKQGASLGSLRGELAGMRAEMRAEFRQLDRRLSLVEVDVRHRKR